MAFCRGSALGGGRELAGRRGVAAGAGVGGKGKVWAGDCGCSDTALEPPVKSNPWKPPRSWMLKPCCWAPGCPTGRTLMSALFWKAWKPPGWGEPPTTPDWEKDWGVAGKAWNWGWGVVRNWGWAVAWNCVWKEEGVRGVVSWTPPWPPCCPNDTNLDCCC